MKTLVVVVGMVALACGAFAVKQEGQGERPGKQEGQGERPGKQEGKFEQGIKVMKADQAEWKAAEGMPPGVMASKVAEGKNGACVYLMKFPAGTRVSHTASANKVIHVHHGKLEFSQGGAGHRQGQGQGQQQQPGQGQPREAYGQGQQGQAQTASDGDLVKISAQTSYSFTASSETLAVVMSDAPMKGDASGQKESEELENKVR